MSRPKVGHLTSVHPAYDARVLHKECKALAEAGYEVVLVVPHDRDEVADGVRIRAVPRPQGRLQRMTCTVWHVYRAALEENAQMYHFHDPELIPVGLLLRARGKRVIYDVHEDYVSSIEQKRYLPHLFRTILARFLGGAERLSTSPFEIIIAEKYYARRFPNGIPVLNYPIRERIQIHSSDAAGEHNRPRLLYTGVVSEDRGALIHARIVNMMSDIELYVVGRCGKDLADRMRQVAGGERLHIEGEGFHVPYERIMNRYVEDDWIAGLAVFPPTPHYMEKELTKLFEYMCAGIPIVCSDFPVWRSLIEETGAGLCVDPLELERVIDVIQYLIDHPDEVRDMGRNGRQAVAERYNWNGEKEKLVEFYSRGGAR